MGAALKTKSAYFKIGPMRTFWCLEKHLERYFPMVSEISSLLAAVVLKWLTNHSVKILPVCYYMSNIKRREEIIFWHILLIFLYVCISTLAITDDSKMGLLSISKLRFQDAQYFLGFFAYFEYVIFMLGI